MPLSDPAVSGGPVRRWRASRPLALAVGSAALLLAACGGKGDSGPPPSPASVQALDAGARAGVVGTTLAAPVRVRVADASGRPLRGAAVAWTASGGGSVAPGTSATNADGVAEASWTLGTVAGAQEVVASAGAAVSTTLSATATPGQPASVRVTRDTTLPLLPGVTVRLTAAVVDQYGNRVTDAVVRWATSDAAVGTIDELGALALRGVGPVTVSATADALRGEMALTVAAVAPLSVTRVTPATLTPGAVITVEGAGFVAATGTTTLLVSGVPATVSEMTPSRITAVVPAQGALPCEPLAAGRVGVRRTFGAYADSASLAVAVDASVARSLAVGESVNMTDGIGCIRLDPGARYLVSVYNTRTDLLSSSSLRVRGASATGGPAVAADAGPSFRLSDVAQRAPTPEERALRAAADEHARHLENERAIVARLGSPLPALEAARRAGGGARPALSRAAAVPQVGDMVTINALYSSCSRSTPVRARVVHVGAKSIVYEDSLSPVAGKMDDEFRRVGEEFDRVQLPLIERYFGSPLAMDARLDGDGRIAMLFTNFVNDSVPNAIGFVTSCNFRSRTEAPASNQREIFYARVPRGSESPSEWRYNLRSTVIHEVKHLTAYAERFARGGGPLQLEEGWLEESTARLAEEYYARTFSGAEWKANAGFAAVGCEVTRCDDRPRMMLKHYTTLADFYSRVSTLSPLGGVSLTDATYYASGWLLVRWALDHYAGDEESFVRALTTETGVFGLSNLARRAGRPAVEMLADWSLAMAADDRAGFTPRRAQLAIPSWNTRDVFQRLNATDPIGFRRQFPLTVQQVPWGAFTLDVPTLRAWSAAFFELGGAAGAGPQLVELRGGAGSALSPQTGMAIVRVE